MHIKIHNNSIFLLNWLHRSTHCKANCWDTDKKEPIQGHNYHPYRSCNAGDFWTQAPQMQCLTLF